MLDSIRSTVHQHYHALLEQDGYVTSERVKNAFLGKIERGKTLIEFFEMHNEQYLQKVKMNTTDKTYSRYELTKKRLIEFMKLKYSVSVTFPLDTIRWRFRLALVCFLRPRASPLLSVLAIYVSTFLHELGHKLMKTWVGQRHIDTV